MKVLTNEDGFTLIEILVAISLMVIAVSLIISFYLFASKFIRSVTLNLNEKEKINQFVFNISENLQKSDDFVIQINNGNVLINLSDGKKINFSPELISLADTYELRKFGSYNFSLALGDGEKIKIDSNNSISPLEQYIPANRIDTLNIDINYEKRDYNITYTRPLISYVRFVNIK